MADGNPPPQDWNPQLPPPPQGAYTDAQYAADEASLRQDIVSRYHDILQQLGYTDEHGNFIPGLVEVEANRRRGELGYNMGQAQLGVTRAQQQRGTLFSGRRAEEQAQAEHPYITSLAQLEEDVPRQLAGLYSHAGGLISEYATRNAGLLASAAARYVPPAATGDAGPAPADFSGSAAAPTQDPVAAAIAPALPTAAPAYALPTARPNRSRTLSRVHHMIG